MLIFTRDGLRGEEAKKEFQRYEREVLPTLIKTKVKKADSSTTSSKIEMNDTTFRKSRKDTKGETNARIVIAKTTSERTVPEAKIKDSRKEETSRCRSYNKEEKRSISKDEIKESGSSNKEEINRTRKDSKGDSKEEKRSKSNSTQRSSSSQTKRSCSQSKDNRNRSTSTKKSKSRSRSRSTSIKNSKSKSRSRSRSRSTSIKNNNSKSRSRSRSRSVSPPNRESKSTPAKRKRSRSHSKESRNGKRRRRSRSCSTCSSSSSGSSSGSSSSRSVSSKSRTTEKKSVKNSENKSSKERKVVVNNFSEQNNSNKELGCQSPDVEILEVCPPSGQLTELVSSMLLSCQAIQEERIILNIGGTCFQTSRVTLRADPTSVFAFMLLPQSPFRPNTNTYFFDRDPAHFRFILNYLRNGCCLDLNILPREQRYLQELLTEAKYYKLMGLMEVIQTRLCQVNSYLYPMEAVMDNNC